MKKLFSNLLLGMSVAAVSAFAFTAPNPENLKVTHELSTEGTAVSANIAEETEFGRSVLEAWKKAGVELPLPEEEILRLKPGKKHLNDSPEVELDSRLRFTGFLQYSNVGGKIRLPYGFYTFSPATGLNRSIYKELNGCLNGGGAYVGNRLHGMSMYRYNGEYWDSSSWGYYEWDSDTWVETTRSGDMYTDLVARASDYDPKTGKVYGVKSGGIFAYIDYENRTSEDIVRLPFEAVAMAIDNDGVGYVLDNSGTLYSLNIDNGDYKKIGDLDFVFYAALQSMTFDRNTGKLYLAASEGNYEEGTMYGRLCEVNLNDATTRLVGYFPDHEEYTVLHVLYTPEDNAPGSISDLKATYADASLEGKLQFTMPTLTFGGTQLTGDVDYSIYVNDANEPAVKGTAAPGEYVEETVIPEEGRTKYVVVLSNSYGEGERNAIESWGGSDNPAVHDLKAVYDEDTKEVNLTWTVSNVGEKGGYADLTGITYEVYRFPGPTPLAEGLTEGKFIDNLSGLDNKNYYYTVMPVKGWSYYKESTSNYIFGGDARELPYYQDFENNNSKFDFLFVDSNNDGKTWQIDPNWEVSGAMWCNCSAYLNSDDWALSPAFKFEEGQTYTISYEVSSMNGYPEKYELAIGEGLDPLNYEIIVSPTVVTTPTRERSDFVKVNYICTKTGDYHIGFHGISDANLTAIVIDNISVEKGFALKSPSHVINMAVIPAQDGELSATVEFDAPLYDMAGDELTNITKVTLYRGENLDYVNELTDVKPGQHYVIEDPDAMNGMILYTLVASNEAGDGEPATASGYVGIDIPLAPTDLTMTDNLDGTYTLTWKTPEGGVNGGFIDEDELFYNIYMLKDDEPVLIKSDIYENSYNVTNLDNRGDQAIEFFFVSASNDVNESKIVEFPAIFTGTPYTVPFMEGFNGNNLTGIWLPQTLNCSWKLYSGASADNDNYVMGCQIGYNEAYGKLSSGKISIKNIETPKLAFSFYAYPGVEAFVEAGVRVNGGEEEQLIKIDFNDLTGPQGFRTVLVDLDKYKNSEYIIIVFNVYVENVNDCDVVLFDDINVRNVPAYNIEQTAQIQTKATAGDKVSVDVTLFNVGQNEESDYSLDIFVNGKLYNNLKGNNIMPFDRDFISYEIQTSPVQTGDVDIRIELISSKDMIEEDNITEGIVTLYEPLLNKVENIAVTEEENNIIVEWSEPSDSNIITESFEGYKPFKYDGFGDWKVIDGDGMSTMSVIRVDFPGAYEAGAFFTVDFVSLGYSPEIVGDFIGHTGYGYIACMVPSSLNSDDWAISPILSGEAQTIKLWAKSLGAIFDDTFEIMYSTTNQERDSFISLQEFTVTEDYEEYSVELPAGAQYFAIHCNSFFGGMLMIDDITYEVAPRVLKGYNVYKNYEFLDFVSAPSTRYSEPKTPGDKVYVVTAVYEEGESAPSDEAKYAKITSAQDSHISISEADGYIIVKGVEGEIVTITSLDGMNLYNDITFGDIKVPAAQGVYIVKVANKSTKVIVR